MVEGKICQENNPRVPFKAAPGEFLKLEGPGREIIIDYVDMGELSYTEKTNTLPEVKTDQEES